MGDEKKSYEIWESENEGCMFPSDVSPDVRDLLIRNVDGRVMQFKHRFYAFNDDEARGYYNCWKDFVVGSLIEEEGDEIQGSR